MKFWGQKGRVTKGVSRGGRVPCFLGVKGLFGVTRAETLPGRILMRNSGVWGQGDKVGTKWGHDTAGGRGGDKGTRPLYKKAVTLAPCPLPEPVTWREKP